MKKIKSFLLTTLAIVVFLVSSAKYVSAAGYSSADWSVYSMAPGAESKYCTVMLYATEEEYIWNVSKASIPNDGYAFVQLSSSDCEITTINGSKNMVIEGNRRFFADKQDTSTGVYSHFTVTLYNYSYGPSFTGSIYIN